MLKKLFHFICLSSFLLFAACQPQSKPDLIVGTISGPETDLVKVAQRVANEKYKLNIKIIEFNDYHLPNEALADGSIDMNIYQHQAFLDASLKAKHYPIKAISKTFIYPMGIYSNKLKSIEAISNHAIIAIPNDPSNETRALQLLEKANLIICSPNKDILSPRDILENRKQLEIKELDAAQLPRVLPDVSAAVINTTFAIPAGLNPKRDAIFLESKDSPYANLMVVKSSTVKNKAITQFIKAMHDKKVIAKAKELFGDGAIPAW